MSVSVHRQLAGATFWAVLALLILATAPLATAQADSDGDGVPNDLELAGFRFDLSSGEPVACNPATDSPCYVTDPLAWSSDGDPYSDFQEASGVNMDASVEAPYNSPLVAAYPVIEVALDSYTFTSNATITDSDGGALTSGSSYAKSVSETASASITVGAEYNVVTGPTFSGEASASYSRTDAYSNETTSGEEINWETATTTEVNNAGTLSLSLFARNTGGATALNVRPTFNISIGGELVATVLPDEDAPLSLSLTPGASSVPSVPIIGGEPLGLTLTFDQLLALERGGAVSIEVVDILADIQRWRPEDSNWACGTGDTCTWTSFQNQIEPRTMRLIVDFGYSGDPDADIPARFQGNPFDYLVYTGSPNASPNLTLRDVLGFAGFDVTGSGASAAIEGRSYLNSWILYEQPDAGGRRRMQEAWQAAGQPQSMLDVVMPRQAILGMTSPDPLDPGVAIRTLGVTPDFLNVRAVVAARGGVPVKSAVATVVQNGITRTVELQPVFGRAYWSTEGSGLPDTPIGLESSYVEFTDLAGDVQRSSLPLTIQQAASCAGVREEDLYPAPGPGSRAIVFPTGQLDGPVEVYCDQGSDVTRYWVPQSFPVSESIPDFWLQAAARMDDGTVVAGGTQGIARSEDGGRSWAVATQDYDRIGQIASRPGTQTLLAALRIDRHIRSTDGGRTWLQPTGAAFLDRITHGGDGVWYALQIPNAGNALVHRSDTDGVIFTALPTQPVASAFLTDLAFRDANTGLVLNKGDGTSGSGGIWRTDDGGATWTRVLRSHNDSYITYAGDETWIVSGGGGGASGTPQRFLRSTDDGLTWTVHPISTPINTHIGPGRAAFLTPEIGYAPVSSTGFLKTEDGGDTWSFDSVADGFSPQTVLPFDEQRAIAVGTYRPSASELSGVTFITTSGGTGSVIVSNEEPAEPVASPTAVTLEPNAPNPFRDRTTVVYTLDAPGDVELAIYDLLGREVARLVDAPQAAGEHRVAFEARGMAPGVYVARLTMGGEVATRRMTLVR